MDVKSTSALALIPQGASLIEHEQQVASWIEDQQDASELRRARALLAAWRMHAEHGSGERDAAIRLDIRVERRLGMLPDTAPKPAGRPGKMQTRRPELSAAEQRALSRARALAAIPTTTFEEVLAEPKPSRAKVLARAIVSEPTRDPIAEESARVYHLTRPPKPLSWPANFQVDLLNEKAVLTIRETVESWRRWCDRWEAALATTPKLRSVK